MSKPVKRSRPGTTLRQRCTRLTKPLPSPAVWRTRRRATSRKFVACVSNYVEAFRFPSNRTFDAENCPQLIPKFHLCFGRFRPLLQQQSLNSYQFYLCKPREAKAKPEALGNDRMRRDRRRQRRSGEETLAEGPIDPNPNKGSVANAKINADTEAAAAVFVDHVKTMGVEGLRKEFADLKGYVAPNADCNQFKANEARNRYKDVMCVDATRVVLTLNVPPDTDYIHANWVKLEGLTRPFIATQGPLDTTIADFWRMIHQEGIGSILMLCKVEEAGKPKCAQYWPLEQGAYQTYGTMFVNNKKVEKEDTRFVSYTLEVLPEGCSNSTVTKLHQMLDWPDRGVPVSAMSVLRLAKCISPTAPCVVHCSAGIGRTGTIIAMETILARIMKGQQVNIQDVFKQIRDCRASSIQTEGQYVFLHLCVLFYIGAKIKKHVPVMNSFHEEFKKAGLN
ncbi:hypothetical protein L596_021185 [Steinernema carpocapsae]|uniref:Tyrosine-protein phosphatase domain-containing protein n=1 Tax=Steinernema carpocapsae TaxID=34508 RepID=A0A4V6A154_STECR|nr:hypothetical protein L596_021185 [Steinernema carpocapsae]